MLEILNLIIELELFWFFEENIDQKPKLKKMNFNSKTYKSIFLTTTYFDRTNLSKQNYDAKLVNF